jgi:hypothetical protein
MRKEPVAEAAAAASLGCDDDDADADVLVQNVEQLASRM